MSILNVAFPAYAFVGSGVAAVRPLVGFGVLAGLVAAAFRPLAALLTDLQRVGLTALKPRTIPVDESDEYDTYEMSAVPAKAQHDMTTVILLYLT